MSSLLIAVTRAANRRTASDEAYRAAIRDANAAGHSSRAIAKAAGISHEGVRYILNGDPRKAARDA